MAAGGDCIFCKIVAGQLPCSKVYEDERVLAFLDIGPVVKGHVLVIPKTHWQSLDDIPGDALAELARAVQKIARGLVRGLGAEGVNLHQANGKPAGQVVPHVHFHVIPRFAGDRHSWNWRQEKYAGVEEMSGCAQRIRSAL